MRLGLPLLVLGFAIGISFNKHYEQKTASQWASEVTRESVNACIKDDKLVVGAKR